MKSFIVSLIFIFLASVAYAQNTGSIQELKSLLQHKAIPIKEVDKANDLMYNLVEKKLSQKESIEMKDLLELCVLYFQHDSSDAVYDWIHDLYQSNPQEFNEATRHLSQKDQKQIHWFLKIATTAQDEN